MLTVWYNKRNYTRILDSHPTWFLHPLEREKVRLYDKVNRNRNRNKEIDTIEYNESLGMSCFQGFLTVYR